MKRGISAENPLPTIPDSSTNSQGDILRMPDRLEKRYKQPVEHPVRRGWDYHGF